MSAFGTLRFVETLELVIVVDIFLSTCIPLALGLCVSLLTLQSHMENGHWKNPGEVVQPRVYQSQTGSSPVVQWVKALALSLGWPGLLL